ncbi:MAG: hypothetical protein NVSMB59_14740 [Vulcanimicrobiaceae bacterium]
MARLIPKRLRTLGVALAVVSLAAACSRSAGTSGPVPTASAVVPTPSGVPAALASPCAAVNGIAYEPDAGMGGAFKGIQVTQFEDRAGNLCAATAAPNATPPGVAFASAVGPLAFATDLSDAIAVLANATGGFTLAQDIFGANVGSIVPVGAPYDLASQPTPSPTATSSTSPAPTATPANAPLIADAQSIAILGGGLAGVALTTGVPAAGSPNALVALTSLTNAPPQYGQSVPFSGASYTLRTIPNLPRTIVRVGISQSSGGNFSVVALARGPQDLLAFSVSAVGTGYRFDAQSDDTTLGSGATLRGSGAIAFSPLDASRALVGGTSGGASTQLTLVTGMPSKLVSSSTLGLPGAIRSIAVTANGAFGVVGTDVGIVVVKGVDTGTLSFVAPFAPNPAAPSASAPTYRTCSGAPAALTNVASVGVSADARYLVALGTSAGVACASGYNDSIVAVALNAATGTTPSPAPVTSGTPPPASFVQNNIIAPPVGADYLFVH